MKLARFQLEDQIHYGVVIDDALWSISGDIFGDFEVGSRFARLADVRLLPPVAPRSIVAVGINYPRRVTQHYAAAPGEQRYQGPVIFLLPTSSLIGHRDSIVFPPPAQEIGAAGELVVVMQKRTKAVSPDEAAAHILGYTCGNDLASPDLLRADRYQTLRAHGFDTATVMGPYIETDLAPDHLIISLRINGTLATQGSTASMIYSVPDIVSYVSRFMTLYPGDAIFMGTPMGSPVIVGDIVEVEIDGIGLLRNPVIAA